MNGYKELLERISQKVGEMMHDCYETDKPSISEIVTELNQIKQEIDSMGTRPTITLKHPVHVKSLHEQIEQARTLMVAANDGFYTLINQCTEHDIQGKDDGFARCRVCGRTFGWFCKTSPTKQCEYNNGEEECKHCGLPEDRK